jgi:hypothetical protein
MKKILTLAVILLTVSIGYSQMPKNFPLGKSKTEIYTIFLKDLKFELTSEYESSVLFTDKNLDIGHVCMFNAYNRVFIYYVLFDPHPELMKVVIDGMDKNYYRVEQGVMLWTESYDSKKSKYIMSVYIDTEGKDPIGVIKYYYNN